MVVAEFLTVIKTSFAMEYFSSKSNVSIYQDFRIKKLKSLTSIVALSVAIRLNSQ